MPGINLCERVIAADIISDCENPVSMGYEKVGYIMNFKDVTAPVVGHTVAAITLASTKKAYHVYSIGKQPFNGGNTTLTEQEIKDDYTKTVMFKVLDDGPDVAEMVETLNQGEFVLVIPRKWNGNDGAGKFEIIGLETGARSNAQVCDVNANGGGWDITMIEEHAPSAKIFFDAGGIEASRAALEALVTGAA